MKKFIPFLCVLFLMASVFPAHAGPAEKVITSWVKLSKKDLGDAELKNLVEEATEATKKWYDSLILFKKYSRLRETKLEKISAEWGKLNRGLKELEADMKADNKKKTKKYRKAVKAFRTDVFSEAGENQLSEVDPTQNIAFAPRTFVIDKRYNDEVLKVMRGAKRVFRNQAAELRKHCKELDKLYNEKEKWQGSLMGANSRMQRARLTVERHLKNISRREASIGNIPNPKHARKLLKQIELTEDMVAYRGSFSNLWEP